MSSRLRWCLAAGLVALVVLAFVANVALDIACRRRLGVTRVIAVGSLELPTDLNTIAWGRHRISLIIALSEGREILAVAPYQQSRRGYCSSKAAYPGCPNHGQVNRERTATCVRRAA